jgi:hypothetical protein
MTPTLAAELAMTASFVVCAVVASLFVVPWARTVGGRRALVPLLGVHIGRHIALQLLSAQQLGGFGISDAGRDEIMYGDVAGMILALVALVAAHQGWRLWRAFAWAFVAATALDLGNALVVGLREELFAMAQNVSWLILTFYVPLLWVTLALVVWDLVVLRDPNSE